MMPPAQGEQPVLSSNAPGMFIWEVPGKPVVVHFPLNVIERLSTEMMRNYGANPKRSPEVGGVLFGAVIRPENSDRTAASGPTIVRVDDFQIVACDYRRGPSYVFTDEDSGPFEAAAARADRIGYFRSHTREGLTLAPEDLDLLNQLFDGPFYIALLVKPYATKASLAGIFVREDGVFPAQTPREFPFRLQELTGAEPPPRRPLGERRPKLRDLDPSAPPRRRMTGYSDAPSQFEPSPGFSEPREEAVSPRQEAAPVEEVRGEEETSRAAEVPAYIPQRRPGLPWIWVVVCVFLLLLGVAAGFQGALNFAPRTSADAGYALSLLVSKADQNLNVRWDPQSPAVRASSHAVMEIEEQGITKPVPLDGGQLQAGLLIYRYATNAVKFRLTVYPKATLSVSESVEWRQ
jgi:hypothetical protein